MKKVLVLDDDRQIVEALSIILKTSGYSVIAINDTENLWQIIDQEKPDILVIDVRLKDEDGRDLAHDIKHNPTTEHIPIILISARVGALSNEELRGADLYMAKPFRLTELLNNIQKLLFRD